MFLSLPPATKMFQFTGLPPHTLWYSGAGACTLLHAGFPIRKSADRTAMCAFPQLIAACHVLHRLLLPGHPPCALIRLTVSDVRSSDRCHSGFLRYYCIVDSSQFETLLYACLFSI